MAEVDYNFDGKTEADILHADDDLSRPVLHHLCKRGKRQCPKGETSRSPRLQIEKFDRVDDAYDQAKKQFAGMKRPAAASAASRGKNTRTDARPPRSQSAAGGGNISQSVSREEVKRREMLHGLSLIHI